MAEASKIEWCDSTFNPWIGCTKVSPGGCANCYAEVSTPARVKRAAGIEMWGPHGQRQRTSAHNWKQPLAWERQHEAFHSAHGRRQRVFCASLADVFDNAVPEHWRWDLFRLIAATPHLDWLLLTKRIGNARAMLNSAAAAVAGEYVGAAEWDREPWPNVWLGATVVDQAEADRDIPKLLATRAAVRFLSIEPMLGPVDLLTTGDTLCRCEGCMSMARSYPEQAGLQRIDWVICGSESGPHARRDAAMLDWVRSLRDQCSAAGVPFLWKQDADRGRKIPTPELDGRTWVEFPR